jgi:hypothetical protein
MKVPYGEGLAIHTGPESCVCTRKGISEASTGEVRAGLLSRERYGRLRGVRAVNPEGARQRGTNMGSKTVE